jgi:hypothetical protein
VIVKVTSDCEKYEIVKDVVEFREKNEYRYIRHATIRGDTLAFVSE